MAQKGCRAFKCDRSGLTGVAGASLSAFVGGSVMPEDNARDQTLPGRLPQVSLQEGPLSGRRRPGHCGAKIASNGNRAGPEQALTGYGPAPGGRESVLHRVYQCVQHKLNAGCKSGVLIRRVVQRARSLKGRPAEIVLDKRASSVLGPYAQRDGRSL